MNAALRLLLKLFSTSAFDIRKNYQAVRDFQRLISLRLTADASFLDYSIKALDGLRDIPIRIFYPEKSRKPGAIVFFHGGGWVIGDIESYTLVCQNMAQETGQVVFSVDYRLAPEHPFPAALEDCITAGHTIINFYSALDDEYQGPVTFIGDSAGANLAAVVSLFLAASEAKEPDRLVLFYPATYWDHNPETSPFESVRSMGFDYGLTSKKVQDYMELYIPDQITRQIPEVAPLLSDHLYDLPPTLILTAEFDPLRDEGEALGLVLRRHEVPGATHRILGAPHGYLSYPDLFGAVEESYALIKAFFGYPPEEDTASEDQASKEVEQLKLADFDQENNIEEVSNVFEKFQSRINTPEELAYLSDILDEIEKEKENLADEVVKTQMNEILETTNSQSVAPETNSANSGSISTSGLLTDDSLVFEESLEFKEKLAELENKEKATLQADDHELAKVNSKSNSPDKEIRSKLKETKKRRRQHVKDKWKQERQAQKEAKRNQQRRNWLALDNASKIFPSTMSSTDTKVFRFTVELFEEVDPDILQEALDITYDNFPLYNSILRRGMFWYYFQESQERPIVEKETEAPVQALYRFDNKNLLFRVLYYKKRIHLEVFHALSDGTGASWFLQLLISNYLNLRYPDEESPDAGLMREYANTDLDKARQIEDSFAKYFARPKQKEKKKTWQKLREQRLLNRQKDKEDSEKEDKEWKNIYQIRGHRTPDHRMRIFESSMSVSEVIKLAKERNTSLSVFLTSVYILAIYRDKLESQAYRKNEKTTSITISVPVNLRGFYPSHSARNFFATVKIGYEFEGEQASLEDICQSVHEQYQSQITKDKLEDKLYKLYKFEENLALRPVFRPVKDFVLKIINKLQDRKLTAALSNMGRISFPEEVEDHIARVFVFTAVRKPQFACISFKDEFTLTFSSPYIETGIQKHFYRILTDLGLDICIGTNNILEE